MQQAIECDLLPAGGRDMMTQQEYMQYTGMQADSIASDGHFTGYAKSSFHVAVQNTYSNRHECLCHGLALSIQVEFHGLATDAVMRTWAARYNTWFLIKLTPKGVVFSFLLSAAYQACASLRFLAQQL